MNIKQELVLRQQYRLIELIDRSNEMLDQKANSMLQAASLVVALIGLFGIAGFQIDSLSTLAKAAVIIAFLAFIGMVGSSLIALSPKEVDLPGTLDWKELFQLYLDPGINNETAFNQVLSNYLATATTFKAVNGKKSNRVTVSAALLILQVGSLLVLILVS